MLSFWRLTPNPDSWKMSLSPYSKISPNPPKLCVPFFPNLCSPTQILISLNFFYWISCLSAHSNTPRFPCNFSQAPDRNNSNLELKRMGYFRLQSRLIFAWFLICWCWGGGSKVNPTFIFSWETKTKFCYFVELHRFLLVRWSN